MHVSLDRHGRVIQAGEGSFNTPMGVDEVDNSLSSPNAQAASLWERSRAEYATMAALERKQAFAQAQASAHDEFVSNLAADYEEQVAAESAEANGGEHPLLYAAAMQSMAGRTDDQWHPISGYLLSQDGELAYDRAMSGNDDWNEGLGQVQNLIQSAQADAQSIQSAVSPLLALAQGGQPAAAAPASAPAASNALSNFMSMKVGGVPAPYVAGAVLALLLLRK